jgi:GntR family transcriptional regulator
MAKRKRAASSGAQEPLTFDSATPLYRQIADRLYAEIANGVLAPGAPIGSETELQERFKVSRVTLRQAVGLLVEQGLVVRRQGKGTFVEATPLEFPLDTLQGTTQLATTLGRSTNSRVVRVRSLKGSAELRRVLGMQGDGKLTQVTRLDQAGTDPLALATIHLPDWIGSRLSRQDFAEPLYPLLEDRLGVVATEAHQTIHADRAEGAVAELLQVAEGDPVLTVTRLTRDARNEPIEHSVIHFKANVMQFSISLRRGAEKVDLPYRYHERLRYG